MALGGITQFIDGLYGSVHSRIVANGVLTAGNIVVDGARQTDAGNSLVGQCTGPHKGSVTTNNHQRINAQFLAAGQALGLPVLRLELQTTGRIQNRAAAVNNFRHAANVHLIAFAVDQAIVTALNAHHAISLTDTRTHNGANCRIHAGRVTATGQNTDCFDFLSHKAAPPIWEHSVTYNNFLTIPNNPIIPQLLRRDYGQFAQNSWIHFAC